RRGCGTPAARAPCGAPRRFEEASSINFRRSVTYGLGVLLTTMQFALQKWGLGSFRMFSAKGRKLETNGISYYARGVTGKRSA
ncbi:MAG TPA: hypothetical protein VLL05_21295, partial [Terriglobales bacterium]|nr:hypothetical protein [Terriglobales bacterium]